MENQKYISELQNILNKKKMDGGFGERFQEELLQERMFPNQQTKSGENQIKETSIDNDPNRELKNTFEKVNFQSEIETLGNYLGMLKECDNNDISKFIKTNKINQEQIAINENAVNKLENTNNELKESIKKKEKEIAELKKTQSGENAKYQKELENERVKIFDKEEKLKEIKEKLEKLQQESAEGVQDNGSNNDEINSLKEQLNLLKSEIDKKKNEKKKLESKEVKNVEKLKLEEAELESLKKMLENNITEIEKLKQQNEELKTTIKSKLQKKDRELVEKENQINEIKQKLEKAVQELKDKTSSNTDHIEAENKILIDQMGELTQNHINEKKKLDEEISKLGEKISILEKDSDNTSGNDAELEKLKVELRIKNEENEFNLKKKQEQEQELNKEITKNNELLEKEKSQHEITKANLQHLEEQKKILDEKLAAVETQSIEIDELKAQNILFSNEIKVVKTTNDKLRLELTNSIDKLTTTEQDMHNLESNEVKKRRLYEEKLSSQKNEIDRLKAQLNSSQISSPSINNSTQIQRGGKTSGGSFESKDQVLNPNEFKRIKNTIDFIVIKLNNYKKTLEIEKNWKKKYAKKLKIIDRLIDVSKKINKLYEGTGYEKMRDSVSSTWSGIKDKFKKRGGQSRQKSPFRLRSGGDDSGNSAVQEDKDVKPLTKEKCKKLRKYLDEFSQLLAAIDNDEGDPIVEEIKSDVSNLSKKSDVSDLSTSNNSNSLIDKIMNIQRNYTNSDSDSYQNNATEILTKTTMIIYDTLLISIVIICIIVYVLFVINIIKFLYQCFLEVGNSQHNNLLTANTLRYKLLGYVIYINNCNLPALFSSFNSVDTPSSTFIRLTEVLKNYFTNNPIDSVDTFESIFGGLEDTVNFLDTPETKAEKKVDEWRRDTQEGQQADDKTFKTKKKEFLDAEIELGEKEKKREYEENKSYKEPKFNIFLCIRLIFICIKLFITFITIIIISSIICILLAIVSDSINMEKITINIFYNQNLFTLLIQLLAVSLIYIFIQLIIYKMMFVKLYNKYLNTYLNVIAIDLKINFIKSSDGNNLFDKDLAQKLHSNIENDAEIEGRIIQLINNRSEFTKEKVIKYITIYMLLKYLYSYNKDKSHYELCYIYFIKENDNYSISKELNVEKNSITTFYSLIPNKHRSAPINYFKFNDIKNIDNIEYGEEIRETVNDNISQINTFISEANSYFDDDNFIVSLGWYILVNLILGTIYISIIVMITLKDIGDINNFDFNDFVKFNH